MNTRNRFTFLFVLFLALCLIPIIAHAQENIQS